MVYATTDFVVRDSYNLRVLDVERLLLATQRLDEFLVFTVGELVFLVKRVSEREHVVLIDVGAHVDTYVYLLHCCKRIPLRLNNYHMTWLFHRLWPTLAPKATYFDPKLVRLWELVVCSGVVGLVFELPNVL